MPLSDADRIRSQTPRIVALWQALTPLRSCISFMNTGAHPDDETSGMLAALAWRDGFDLSYACATRGEGGQNDIGTEAGADLGALRTAEMEAAARVLPLRLYWLGQSADDPITDFGFSKSGVETLARWGRDRTLARFVEILRTERPDIVCPTFLDVPGQHGHHRAMTELARVAVESAADPGFAGCDLPPWPVAKLYLPAWSGAGQAYDDDLPPPPASLVIDGQGADPVTGWTWEQIGQRSRVRHATQGMGRWLPRAHRRDWPLHLVRGPVARAEDTLTTGLPATLRDLAAYAQAPALAAPLEQAQDACDACLAAFPDGAAILTRATDALRALRAARDACPEPAAAQVLHRLARKQTQVATLLRIAAGAEVSARAARDWLRPGDPCPLEIEAFVGAADRITVNVILPEGWQMSSGEIVAGLGALPFEAWRDTFRPDEPPAPALAVTLRVLGVESTSHLPFETPPLLQPARTAALIPAAAVLNRRAEDRDLAIAITDVHPAGAEPALSVPPGWQVRRTAAGVSLSAPDDVAAARHDLALTLDGEAATTLRRIAFPHIAPTLRLRPARLALQVIDVAVPAGRIAVFGAGNDRVALWLAAMGCDVEEPGTDIGEAALARFDSVVIGIFALRARDGLAALMPRLLDWVERGGTLLTLYHRPWDDWAAGGFDIEIGQPSLRWRVTDETAAVTHLQPSHPVLTTPNAIGPEDWAGWHKERGLYFAKSWGEAYVPLLSMADPGEAPQEGALLSAQIGAGRHTHASLILHHQMERLTPGAFALMANLVAPSR